MGFDDFANVEQPSILFRVTGIGTPVETIEDIFLPGPPEGCESRQLLDHGSVIAILTQAFTMGHKLRYVNAYTQLWDIEIKKLTAEAFHEASQKNTP